MCEAETDWLIEAHEPLDGRHSQKDFAVMQTFADVRDFMKKHPGMIFRVTVPHGATGEEKMISPASDSTDQTR